MRKKLIEVALPLDAINAAAAHEKMPGIGTHPRGIHLWWARRPLAACRAVLFASLIDDPASRPDRFPTEAEQDTERQRLFRIIETMVKWESTTNEHLLAQVREEIRAATDGTPPSVYDPFAGGGSIPLEAQRLGLDAHASDLNPVAVLINKALIELPPKYAHTPPVSDLRLPILDLGLSNTSDTRNGLAQDVRFYGAWMRDEAHKRIGHLYPDVPNASDALTPNPSPDGRGASNTSPSPWGRRGQGDEGTSKVIAWLWARTVRCPNPACGAQMPLISTFWLSKKKGKEAWIEPVVDQQTKTVRFTIGTGTGTPHDPPKMGRGAMFRCLVCGEPADERNIRTEFQAKRNGVQMTAIVAESKQGRIYLPPNDEHIVIAQQAQPVWKPEAEMNQECSTLVSGRGYGITHWYELFTPRQLVALTTFSDLVGEARDKVLHDATAAGIDDPAGYADAVATYLAFAVDRCADFNCAQARWVQLNEKVMNVFSRQAIPMVWDFAEVNILAAVVGGWETCVAHVSSCMKDQLSFAQRCGIVQQKEATVCGNTELRYVISTDPPYYDNIAYADLSDFFYVWLRRSLGSIYPELFSTLLVPKAQELVAASYRFGGDKKHAEQFFERGLVQAFERMWAIQHPDYPMTVYYAFKQAETETEATPVASGDNDNDQHPIRNPKSKIQNGKIASTGWETMLEGLIRAGFTITGTWPMRSEQSARQRNLGANALASSIVLVCRRRPKDAPGASRRQLLSALRRELPDALRNLQHGNVAPVDFAQAAIGPGMAIYSRYSRVLESDGTPLQIRTALQLINEALDEVLSEQEARYDGDTRWAVAWFEQFGYNEGPYGDAETLSTAKNTAVASLVQAGIIYAKGGKVRLLRRDELPADWDPTTDPRLTVWEIVQHLTHALDTRGEQATAALLAKSRAYADLARDLTYRLYTMCERKGWANDALLYNGLVVSWIDIVQLAAEHRQSQLDL